MPDRQSCGARLRVGVDDLHVVHVDAGRVDAGPNATSSAMAGSVIDGVLTSWL